MGRPAEPSPAAVDGAVQGAERLERRWRWLGRFLLTGAATPDVMARLQAHRERVRAWPVAERVAALEGQLDAEGILEQAGAFAARFADPPGPVRAR